MRFSFVLSVLGQTFAIASEPEEREDDELAPFLSVASETERAPIGFAAPEPDYDEEEERRRC